MTARSRQADATEGGGLADKATEPTARLVARRRRAAHDTWPRQRELQRCHPRRHDAVVCQNDEIGLGAVRALDLAATRLVQPEWRAVPVFGCDGLPGEGQRYVREGIFKATVLVPSTSGPAIDAIAGALNRGMMPPAEIVLQCEPFTGSDSS
jgi:hypothetical protein